MARLWSFDGQARDLALGELDETLGEAESCAPNSDEHTGTPCRVRRRHQRHPPGAARHSVRPEA
eukprot:12970934-Alexandrium_andersonii.AAC.1